MVILEDKTRVGRYSLIICWSHRDRDEENTQGGGLQCLSELE